MRCRICGNSRENKEFTAREMMFGFREEFIYFECAQCGCLQIAEIPVDVARYYPSNYYSFEPARNQRVVPFKAWLKRQRSRYGLTGRGILGALLFRIFPARELLSLQRAKVGQHSKILDVGTGSGSLLRELWNAGYKNILGIDPLVEQTIHYPDGPIVLKAALDDITGKWDLIMFHHSFEHIADPRETLRQCSKILNPNGICLIRIPIASSYAWRKYGANWVQLDPPRHFFLHTLQSMEVLAADANFKLVDVMYDSTEFQFWGSEQYMRDIPLYDERSYKMNPSKSIFSASEIQAFRRLAGMLNSRQEGDQAAFYLKK